MHMEISKEGHQWSLTIAVILIDLDNLNDPVCDDNLNDDTMTKL